MQIVLTFKQSIVSEILVDGMLVTVIRKSLAVNDDNDGDGDDDNDDDDYKYIIAMNFLHKELF